MTLFARIRRLKRLRLPFCQVLAFNVLAALILLYLCNIFCSTEPSSSDPGVASSKCSAADSQKRATYLLAIVILTRADGKARRDAIRSTWLKLKDTGVFYKFVVGLGSVNREQEELLKAENSRHDDLLLLSDVEEAYATLTLKVLRSVVWFSRNVQADFVLKVDDDSFVVLSSLYKALERYRDTAPRSSSLYWGFFDGRAKPKRSGKWKEDSFNLCDQFLPYALGGGYVLGSALVEFIAQNSHLFRLFTNEDVSVGTWLAALDVFYVHDQRFDTEHVSRGCFNAYLITHKKSIADFRTLYENIVYSGRLCKTEHRNRLSYEYNWNVAPSLCCIRNDSNSI